MNQTEKTTNDNEMYKQMYFKLLSKVLKAQDILTNAVQECEDIFISTED